MAISFKTAVAKAKKLYKSGRYKKFSDAVKAAYKKSSSSSSSSLRSADRRRSKPRSKPAKRKKTVGTYKPSGKLNQFGVDKAMVKANYETALKIALWKYEKAKTIEATKAARKEINLLRKYLKTL